MSFTKVAPAGIGTEPGTSIRIGDSLLHSTGIDIGTGTGIGVTIRKHGHATFTGIITASAFSGDGSNLIGVASTDNIKTSTTANFTGGIQVGGATTLTGALTGTTASFSGDVGIGGTLTYEDVANIDSVGIITARSGINVSGGNVKIGTTTAGFSTADDLTIATSGSTGITIRTGTTNQGNIYFADGTSGASQYAGLISYNHNTNHMFFGTNDGTERLRIDSSGRVLIGTTSATTLADELVVATSGDCGITIMSGTTHNGRLYFSDSGQEGDGFVDYDHQFGNLKLGTRDITRFTIDSSGRVGVNQSTFATTDTMFSVSETSGHCEIGIISKNDSGVVINMGDTDSYNQGRIKYDNSDNSLTFRTVGTDRLRIISDGDTELRNSVSGINDSYSQYLKFRTTQSNGQSAITGAIRAQGKSGWGGDLVFYSKPANGSPNDSVTERLRIANDGTITTNGNINLSGDATTSNQDRQIYFTGFDKEGTSDTSDYAYIRHTTNVHGITGSVLELRAENDASDGIALYAANGNGQIALSGQIRGHIQMHDYGGYLRPSYGTGDKGISWRPDPAGGSGDFAHIQYYTDGSGENTRLRIQIENDSDDDLRLEAHSIRAEGSFSKSSGSFRIPHVLSGLTTTTDLVHSFVEGPQADNLYRGRTTLVAGISTVNIDTTNNMTEGTFVNLNRDVQCFTTNETGWTAIKGSVTGNLLTIVAQDNTCTDTISWMVIGERWDLAMYDPKNPMTDANGKVKTEIPNDSYNKGGGYEEDYIRQNKYRVGISTISRPSIENKEVE